MACGTRELQSPTSASALPGAGGPARSETDEPDPGEVEARLRSEPEDTEDGSTRVPGGQAGARAVLIGAGDLAQCGLEGVVQTGLLMDKLLRQESDPTLVTFGDNSNDNGSRQRYECFDRWWGRFRSSIWPSPGNHDYETDPASPYYYEYFPHAGTPGRGYYSYDRGSWHIVVLNSELAEASRPAQIVWLETDLRTHPSECTLAYFHRPYLSSGEFAAFRMKRVWDVLYRYGVDVVANGHEHFYAAFPPMAPDGTRDGRFGIRQIIAGTGGARLFAAPVPAYGERIVSQSWGLLKLTLESDRYAWDFVSVNEAVLDHGEDRCHGRPPAGIAF